MADTTEMDDAVSDDEFYRDYDAAVKADPTRARVLREEAYAALRSVGLYADWDDVNFYDAAVAAKEAIGDFLWPDP